MHEKNKNEKEAKVAFEKRVKEAKRTAIEENVKIAKDSGNKLTQNIDADGNLVGVANMNTTETGLGDKRFFSRYSKGIIRGRKY